MTRIRETQEYREAAAEVKRARRGRPPSDTSKVRIGIRLDRDVLDVFRATGPGWQTVINDALKAVAFPAK